MKTAVVISDTHGNNQALKRLIPLFSENDYIIFLGDGETDLYRLPENLQNKIIKVRGNCDLSDTPTERVLEIEGVKLFLTHGHLYGAKYSLERLKLRAQEVGASVCMYGHSHFAAIDEFDGISLINPGTTSRYSAQPSYCYCVFSNGKITAKITDVPTI